MLFSVFYDNTYNNMFILVGLRHSLSVLYELRGLAEVYGMVRHDKMKWIKHKYIVLSI